MDEIKIIVVEDNAFEQKLFVDSVRVYQEKYGRKVDYVFSSNTIDAIKVIDASYDGAIIDLKLEDEEEGGNLIVQKLMESLLRIPVIFVTGHPDLVERTPPVVNVRPRGEGTYELDLNFFFSLAVSGLSKIMGGRGIIEQTLNKVFLENLLPQHSIWGNYGLSDSSRAEKALLRYAINHLSHLLEDEEYFYPEEVYLIPPMLTGFKTGSIVREKGQEKYYVILNPACDLVVRVGGQISTDRLLVVEIDDGAKVYDYILRKLPTQEERSEKLQKIFRNGHTLYHHWLPKTTFFPGGFINFRKLSTLTLSECRKTFEAPGIQISSQFVKDILSRFSSYYARQGQPDIDCAPAVIEISKVYELSN
jgi:hypothetical protein